VLTINGQQTDGMTDVDAFHVIHATSDTVTFVIERGLYNSMHVNQTAFACVLFA